MLYEHFRRLWLAIRRPFIKFIDWRELEAFFIYACARQISKSPLNPDYDDFAIDVSYNVAAALVELNRKMNKEQSAMFFAAIEFICRNYELQDRLRKLQMFVESEFVKEMQDEFNQIKSELNDSGYCFGPVQSVEQIIRGIENNQKD